MSPVASALKGLIGKKNRAALRERNIVASIVGFLLGEDEATQQFNPSIEGSKFALANLSPAKIIFVNKELRVLFHNQATFDALSRLPDPHAIVDTGVELSNFIAAEDEVQIAKKLALAGETAAVEGLIADERVWLGLTQLEANQHNHFLLCAWESEHSYSAIEREYIPLFDSLQAELVRASLQVLDFDSALAVAADVLYNGLQCEFAAIWLRSSRYEELMVSYFRSNSGLNLFNEIRLRKGMGIPGVAWEERRVVTATTNSPRFRDPRIALNSEETQRTLICIPVINQKTVYGVIEIGISGSQTEINPESIKYLSILISDFIATSHTLLGRKLAAEDAIAREEISNKVTSSLNLAEIVDTTAAILLGAFNCQVALIWTLDQTEENYFLKKILTIPPSISGVEKKRGDEEIGTEVIEHLPADFLQIHTEMLMPTIGMKSSLVNDDVCLIDELISLTSNPILNSMVNRGMNGLIVVPLQRGFKTENVIEIYTPRAQDLSPTRWNLLREIRDIVEAVIR